MRHWNFFPYSSIHCFHATGGQLWVHSSPSERGCQGSMHCSARTIVFQVIFHQIYLSLSLSLQPSKQKWMNAVLLLSFVDFFAAWSLLGPVWSSDEPTVLAWFCGFHVWTYNSRMFLLSLHGPIWFSHGPAVLTWSYSPQVHT